VTLFFGYFFGSYKITIFSVSALVLPCKNLKIRIKKGCEGSFRGEHPSFCDKNIKIRIVENEKYIPNNGDFP